MRVNQISHGNSEMPRYFFHLRTGRVTIMDQKGVDLADIEVAKKEAERRGHEIAAQDALRGVPSQDAAIVIADEQWRPIFEVRIKEERVADCDASRSASHG